jgi:triosephosphate isomerase
MRRKLIAGNWKMYKTTAEAVALVEEIKQGLAGAPGDTLVAPPYTALVAVAGTAKGSPVAVAAQNMHFEKEGAFTGEVSAAMLKDVGVTHVVLGHSERRQYFAETDEGVAKKTKVALDNGLVPISCVGETLSEREAGRTMDVVKRQVDAILNALTADEASRIVIAYEPVWAIGTGKVATPEQAQEVHAFIRLRIGAVRGKPVGDAIRILYGGSVKPDNVKGLMALPDVDGALVGGASLKADSFLKLVHYDKQ